MATKDFKTGASQAEAAIAVLEKFVEERFEAILDLNCAMDLKEAVTLMDVFLSFKESLADRVKSPAEKAYDRLRFTRVPNLMDEGDVTSVAFEGIGRVNLQDDVQVKTVAKDTLMEWLVEHELEDMITQNVNAQTLAAFVRRRLKAGEELPGAEILEVKPVVRAAITRS